MEWECLFCTSYSIKSLLPCFWFLIFLLSQFSTFSVNPQFTTIIKKPFLTIIYMLITRKTCVVFTILTYKILVSIVVIFIFLLAYQCTNYMEKVRSFWALKLFILFPWEGFATTYTFTERSHYIKNFWLFFWLDVQIWTVVIQIIHGKPK